MLACGQIHVADGAAAQAVSGTAAKMTGFATLGVGRSNDQGDLSVVPDATNDKITVKGGGRYLVILTISGTNSAAGDVQANIRVAAAEVVGGQCRANFATGSLDNSMSCVTLIEPSVDSDVEVYLEGDAANFTPVFASLTVLRVF